MTHTTTINTGAHTGVGFATANTWIDDNVEAEVDARLREWSARPNRCGSDRHVRQVREAARWVRLWCALIERTDDTAAGDFEALVTTAVEIVSLHWDPAAVMENVMWRCLIDGFDHGHLCLDQSVERILAAAAHRRLVL